MNARSRVWSWSMSSAAAFALGVMVAAGCGSDDPLADPDAGERDNGDGDASGEDRDGDPEDGDAGDGDAGGGGDDDVVVAVPPIAAGLDHTCGLQQGQLDCWGTAADGRLGNSETDGAFPTPEPVLEPDGDPPAGDWAQVAAGGEHSCGIKHDGRLYCWGSDENGQLGTDRGNSAVPVPVLEPNGDDPAADWKQVSTGEFHSCGLKDDGRLFCWGFGNSGNLGDGSQSTSPLPSAVLEPEGAPAASDWAQVAAARHHTCAIKRDGRLFCWGASTNGRLGNDLSTGIPVTSPLAVPDPEGAEPAADWSQVATGTDFTCGLKQDGRLFCWGSHSLGQLGSGDEPASYASLRPVREPGGLEPASDWAQVSAGGTHACAVKQSDQLFCWGEATNGRLGNGDDGENRDTPVAVLEPGGAPPADDWALVSAGMSSHTCAAKRDGRMLCWGNAASGKLGNGDDDAEIDHDTPQAIDKG